MSTTTTNLNLIKYESTDTITPNGYNANFDTLDSEITTLKTDYVVASGLQGDWYYRKWSSGMAECWRTIWNISVPGNSYISQTQTLPFAFTNNEYTVVLGRSGASPSTSAQSGYTWVEATSFSHTTSSFVAYLWNDVEYTVQTALSMHVHGWWK